jgi:HSP20 family protein
MPINIHCPDSSQRDESLGGFPDRRKDSRKFPPVNLYETEAALVVRVEVPGIRIKELKRTVKGKSLTLEGERRLELPRGATYVAQERQHGRFRCVVRLPHPVDAKKLKVKYTDGILTVTLAKAAEAKPRTVRVKPE